MDTLLHEVLELGDRLRMFLVGLSRADGLLDSIIAELLEAGE